MHTGGFSAQGLCFCRVRRGLWAFVPPEREVIRSPSLRAAQVIPRAPSASCTYCLLCPKFRTSPARVLPGLAAPAPVAPFLTVAFLLLPPHPAHLRARRRRPSPTFLPEALALPDKAQAPCPQPERSHTLPCIEPQVNPAQCDVSESPVPPECSPHL